MPRVIFWFGFFNMLLFFAFFSPFNLVLGAGGMFWGAIHKRTAA